MSVRSAKAVSAAENNQVKEIQNGPSAAMKGDQTAVLKPAKVLRKAGVQFYSATSADEGRTMSVLRASVSGDALEQSRVGRRILGGVKGDDTKQCGMIPLSEDWRPDDDWAIRTGKLQRSDLEA